MKKAIKVTRVFVLVMMLFQILVPINTIEALAREQTVFSENQKSGEEEYQQKDIIESYKEVKDVVESDVENITQNSDEGEEKETGPPTKIPKSEDMVYFIHGVTHYPTEAYWSAVRIDGNNTGTNVNDDYVRKTDGGKYPSFPEPNQLAVREDGLFFRSNSDDYTNQMVKMDWNGFVIERWTADELSGHERSGTFSKNGKYIACRDTKTGEPAKITIYDVDKKRMEKSIPININTPAKPSFLGDKYRIGDIVVDKENKLWAVGSTEDHLVGMVLSFDLDTGELLDAFEIKNLPHIHSAAAISENEIAVATEKGDGSDNTRKIGIVNLSKGEFSWRDKLGNEVGESLPKDAYDNFRAADAASLGYLDNKPALKIHKEGPSTAQPGEIYTYKIKITNDGSMLSANTTLKDTLPEGVSYVEESTTLNNKKIPDKDKQSLLFTEEGLEINTPGSSQGVIEVGKEAEIEFKVKVPDEVSHELTIKNSAYVSNNYEKGKKSNDVITTVKPVVNPTGKLSTNKLADQTTVKPGDTVNYTIEVSNIGEAESVLKDIKVEDELPKGVELVENSLKVDGKEVSNEADGNKIQTTVKTIQSNQTVKVTFAAKVTKKTAGEIKNVAVVTDPTNPDKPEKPEATVVVNPTGKLSTNKLADQTTVKPGDTVNYTDERTPKRNGYQNIRNLSKEKELPLTGEMIEFGIQIIGLMVVLLMIIIMIIRSKRSEKE